MLDEEIHLPRQLLDVEGDAGTAGTRRTQLRAAFLQRGDERDGLPIERGVLRRCGRAEMRLQRDVAKIFQAPARRDRPRGRARSGMGTGICANSRATLTNGSLPNSNGARVER